MPVCLDQPKHLVYAPMLESSRHPDTFSDLDQLLTRKPKMRGDPQLGLLGGSAVSLAQRGILGVADKFCCQSLHCSQRPKAQKECAWGERSATPGKSTIMNPALKERRSCASKRTH